MLKQLTQYKISNQHPMLKHEKRLHNTTSSKIMSKLN